MSQIAFQTDTTSDYPYELADIYIDGQRLIDLLKNYENQFGTDLAGSYGPLKPEDLALNLTTFGKLVTIFGCGDCGEYECWPMKVSIEELGDKIIWRNFCQPYKNEWDYENFMDEGQIVFDKSEYLSEVNKLVSVEEPVEFEELETEQIYTEN